MASIRQEPKSRKLIFIQVVNQLRETHKQRAWRTFPVPKPFFCFLFVRTTNRGLCPRSDFRPASLVLFFCGSERCKTPHIGARCASSSPPTKNVRIWNNVNKQSLTNMVKWTSRSRIQKQENVTNCDSVVSSSNSIRQRPSYVGDSQHVVGAPATRWRWRRWPSFLL